jgi:hypothetical protein
MLETANPKVQRRKAGELMRKPRPLHPLVLFSAICLCACSGASSEPSSLPDSAPAIIALLPDANESTVFLTDPITATYDAAMAPADAASFAVHGGFTGTLAGTYAGGGTTTLSFTPSNGFIAGEEIEVTLTDGLSSSAGSAAAPFVYRFRAEVLSGSGSFSGVADVAGQTDVRGVAAGDWDADGNLDLAAANFGASSVAILQNNGNGSFAALQTIPGLQGATALAAGDWNADGNLDLAVANFSSNSVAILQNNGNGAFAVVQTLAGRQGARGLAAGDWDGDGSLDLTSANSGNNNVGVLRNQP